MTRRRLTAAAFLALLSAWFALPVSAARAVSTRAGKALDKTISAGGLFGLPAYTTAALPACTPLLAQSAPVAYDTTVNQAKVCDGTSWTTAAFGGGIVSGTTTCTGCVANALLFNDGGVVSTDAGTSYDKTGDILTLVGGLIASNLTASQLVVSDASKKLVSNGALVTNTIPKAASSGATLVDSGITDDGTTVNLLRASPSYRADSNSAVGLGEYQIRGQAAQVSYFRFYGPSTGGNNPFGYAAAGSLLLYGDTSRLLVGSAAANSTTSLHTGTSLSTDTRWSAGKATTLTSATNTSFAQILVASSTITAGEIRYTVRADDATDFQVATGLLSYRVINKAGTETCALNEVEAFSSTTSAGTLTSAGFVCDLTPTNGVNIQANVTSSLTETTLRISGTLVKSEGAGTVIWQ